MILGFPREFILELSHKFMSYTIKTEKKPEASKHEFKVKDFVKMNRDDSVCMIIDPE